MLLSLSITFIYFQHQVPIKLKSVKRILPFFVILFLLASCKSSSHVVSDQTTTLLPYQVGQYYGFVDQNHKIVIAPTYTAVMPFYKGRAIVFNDQEQWLIDEKGKIIFEWNKLDVVYWNGVAGLKGDWAKEQSCDDYIIFKYKNSPVYQLKDLNGKELFANRQLNNIKIGAANQFIIKNEDNKWGVVDTSNQVIIPFEKNVLIEYRGGGFIKKGDEHYIVKPFYESTCIFYNTAGAYLKDMLGNCKAQSIYSSVAFNKPERLENVPMASFLPARNGYRYYKETVWPSSTIVLAPTGEVVCENCERILNCEHYFIKYTDLDKGAQETQNLVDREGNLFFKNNYDRIKVVNDTENHCPDRFITINSPFEAIRSHVLINENEEQLSLSYKDIEILSAQFLLATNQKDERFILNTNGEVLVAYSDLERNILDINERQAFIYNGQVALVNMKHPTLSDVFYLDNNGQLLFELEPKRKKDAILRHDWVMIAGKERIAKVKSVNLEHKTATIDLFDENDDIEKPFDQLTVIDIIHSNRALKIIEKNEPGIILLDIEIGDYIDILDRGVVTPFVVEQIWEKEIRYQALYSKLIGSKAYRGALPKKLQFIDLLQKIKGVEKKHYSDRQATYPIGSKVYWTTSTDGIKSGFVSQVPIFTNNMIAYEYLANGTKQYHPITPEDIIDQEEKQSNQDTLQYLDADWYFIDNPFTEGKENLGNLAFKEGDMVTLNKNQANGVKVKFEENIRINQMIGIDLNKLVNISYRGHWQYENGVIFLGFGGLAQYSEHRKVLIENDWTHTIEFAIEGMDNDELKLRAVKCTSEHK